ncbi:recombinase RecT [Chryseobacterium sp. DT-3]|uniref:recombinase RecT n=1 Tax=Chryseobacterium sp. DT-3 TaxID=3396164 RepID=UPI003F1E41D8
MSKELTKTTTTVSGFLKDPGVIKRIEELLGERKSTFITSLIQISNSNDLLKNAVPQSILNAGLLATTLNLPLNNSLGHAWIVPFKNNKTNNVEAQFQIGYKGFQQLAVRTGQYLDLDAKKVYEGQIEEDDSFRGYKFNWKNKKSDNVIGYASHFELTNGFKATLFMYNEEIEQHAKRYSQTYKKGFGNWKEDFDKMGLKTVIKLLLNSGKAPLSIEMQNAINADQGIVKNVDNDTIDVDYVDNTPENNVKITVDDKEILRFQEHLDSILSIEELNSLEKETELTDDEKLMVSKKREQLKSKK